MNTTKTNHNATQQVTSPSGKGEEVIIPKEYCFQCKNSLYVLNGTPPSTAEFSGRVHLYCPIAKRCRGYARMDRLERINDCPHFLPEKKEDALKIKKSYLRQKQSIKNRSRVRRSIHSDDEPY